MNSLGRIFIGLALTFCTPLSLATPASAQKRIALIVGNSAYAHAPQLPNPQNDAVDIQSALRALGFEIILGVNADRAQFAKLLKQFGDAIAVSDETLFFYAGHGMQAKGVNYLIPIDAKVRSEQDLEQESVSLDLVLRQMQRAATRIIMLDACRDNPFAGVFAQGTGTPGTSAQGTRAIGPAAGLAVSTASELGTFIAYATQPGNVARDGEGRNSPFTDKLKVHLPTSGQSVTDLMMRVRNEVASETNGAQIPWEHSALSRKFYFRPGTEVTIAASSQKASEAAEAWSWIRNSGNPAMLDEFIRRYGETPFAAQARATLASLKSKPDVVATAVPNLSTMTLRQVQPSFDCKQHYQAAEVAICNNAELSILDNEISRLYVAVLEGGSRNRKQEAAAEQRTWIDERNACGANADCLSKTQHRRVAALARAARSTSSPAAKATPSFDCKVHVLPAEVSVCNDRGLARLDVELDKRYSELARRLSKEHRQALGQEQRQWLVTRDTCASDRRCLDLQYRARIGQVQSRR